MDNKGLLKRRGYTTGICAAAAAKAAAWMLLSGRETDQVHLCWKPTADQTADRDFAVEDVQRESDSVCCAVRKDAGDDIDVTDGLKIYARVSFAKESDPEQLSADSAELFGKVMRIEMPVDEENILAEQMRSESFPSEEMIPEISESSSSEQNAVTVKLKDLENEDGIIPLRWDEAADLFSGERNSSSGEGRLITISEDREEKHSGLQIMEQLFQAFAPEGGMIPGQKPVSLSPQSDQERFSIRGGIGVGIVTKPGLDQPPGEAAINSGPRRMIREAVTEVCDLFEYEGRLQIEISAPGGEKLAEKTFNPRLGIEGGISILGTTGIVEPMSGRAVAETVRTEVRVKAAESSFLALVPGNTGAAFVNEELLIPVSKTVIISNYPGDALDEAQHAGVKQVLLTGSLGKMIKLAGGVFYTHSRDADARMDILIRCALRAGASAQILRRLDGCITTEAAVDLLKESELLNPVMEIVMDRIGSYLYHRAENIDIQVILLRNSGDVLAFTEKAFEIPGEVYE